MTPWSLRSCVQADLRDLSEARLLNASPEVIEHAFDTATKMMATVHRRDGAYLFAVKGAPEAVLASANASGDEDSDAAWMKQCARSGSRGSKSLALTGCVCSRSRAHRSVPDGPPFESLTFLGLVGLEDPPRADVPDAIRACHQAGIRVVMITGDHAVTARSIARAVGLGGDGAARGRGSRPRRALAGGGPPALADGDLRARERRPRSSSLCAPISTLARSLP